MPNRKARPQSVDDYIAAAAPEAKKKLREMRACIRAAAPDATENLKWSMPAYSSHRILVTFAAHKNHIGFYPTPSVVEAFAKNLSKYKTASGPIQFLLDQPLPLPPIRKIAAFRVKECNEYDRKWKS